MERLESITIIRHQTVGELTKKIKFSKLMTNAGNEVSNLVVNLFTYNKTAQTSALR
jgi:hypothetical protein